MDSADNIDTTTDLRAECQRLRKEVARLHHLLRENGIDPFPQLSAPTNSTSSPTEQTTTLGTNSRKTGALSPAPFALSTEQKIELFRSLFRGREDVYAVRWEALMGDTDTLRHRSAIGTPTTRPSLKTVNEWTRKPGRTYP